MADPKRSDQGKTTDQGQADLDADELQAIKDRWFTGWPEEFDVDDDPAGGAR